MKIKIIRDDTPIRVFHHPKEVCHNIKNNTVEIINSDTHEIEEEFVFERKETQWVKCNANSVYSELIIIFYVKKEGVQ